MAIAIKSVPVLKDIAAVSFADRAKKAIAKKSSIDFKNEMSISSKILAKAKL